MPGSALPGPAALIPSVRPWCMPAPAARISRRPRGPDYPPLPQRRTPPSQKAPRGVIQHSPASVWPSLPLWPSIPPWKGLDDKGPGHRGLRFFLHPRQTPQAVGQFFPVLSSLRLLAATQAHPWIYPFQTSRTKRMTHHMACGDWLFVVICFMIYLCCSVLQPFLWINNIPLQGQTTSCSSVCWIMDIG